MLILWWCPFKIQKEKQAGLQFISTDYSSWAYYLPLLEFAGHLSGAPRDLPQILYQKSLGSSILDWTTQIYLRFDTKNAWDNPFLIQLPPV